MPVYVRDNHRPDPRFSHARYVCALPFIRSFLGVPVGADPALPLGVLAIGHTEPGRFAPRQAQMRKRIADLVTSFLVARTEGIAAARRRRQDRSRAPAATSLRAHLQRHP